MLCNCRHSCQNVKTCLLMNAVISIHTLHILMLCINFTSNFGITWRRAPLPTHQRAYWTETRSRNCQSLKTRLNFNCTLLHFSFPSLIFGTFSVPRFSSHLNMSYRWRPTSQKHVSGAVLFSRLCPYSIISLNMFRYLHFCGRSQGHPT